MNRKIKALALSLAVVLGVLLGLHTMATPGVVPATSDQFSAGRMVYHLNTIAAEQRSELQFERRMYVRDYIIDVMEGFGLTAEVDDFYVEIVTYADHVQRIGQIMGWSGNWSVGWQSWHDDLEGKKFHGSNILFRQQGRSDTAIMLIAHLDSAGLNIFLEPGSNVYSPGAADDGYGIVTMLEIARYFAGKDLENSIYFLFTDLHEMGLFGAAQALENMDFSNVSMILNLEARGIRGPVHMFEAQVGAGDLEAMRFFRRALNATNAQPVSYSLATVVWNMMPNNTDLTLFFRSGFYGMNFAPIDNLHHYHTPDDSLEYISPTTMQHYVNTIGAMVNEFVTNPRYSDPNALRSDSAGVYFPLPFQILVLYSETTALILGIVMFVAVVAVTFFLRAKGKLQLRKVACWMAVLVGAVVLSGVLGYTVSLISGVPFLFAFMPHVHEMPIALASVVVSIVGFWLAHRLFVKKFNPREMVVGGLALLALCNLVLQFVLVEATFVTLVPLVVAFAGFALSYLGEVKGKPWLLTVGFATPVVLITMLLVPIVVTITLAITLGGLAVVTVFGVLVFVALPALCFEN